jgi:hypothetical protein
VPPPTEITNDVDPITDALRVAIKRGDFGSTLKPLRKGRVPLPQMMSVYQGVLEKNGSGQYDATLQTDEGHIVLLGAHCPNDESTDAQSFDFADLVTDHTAADSRPITLGELLDRLIADGPNAPVSMICAVELTQFDVAQRQVLLPLLWQYILRNRDSNVPDKLAAVGAAMRKYVAVMPMEKMGQLAELLEPGHRSPLPVELEIEVAKMIYRNFEVHPPIHPDPQPELAARLWEMVQAYVNPRILLRDKHSAIASLSIQAIVAMRSHFAEQAWNAATACQYRWFGELVSDSLSRLRERWSSVNPDAAAWLLALLSKSAVDA